MSKAHTVLLALFVLVMLTMAPDALACSCMSVPTPCQAIGSPVLFVGRVVIDSGEGWGTGPATLAVEEVLRGLPADARSVVVDSSAGTSCYYRFKKGERYVVFAGKGLSGRLDIGACGPTFNLAGKEHVLDALRNNLAGGPLRLVGRVLRSTGLYSHGGGVPGATISVELDGSTQTVYSDTLGNYEFRDLEPGRYRITVSQPGFVGDNDFNNRWSGIMKLDKSKNVYVPDDSPRGTVFIGEKSCAAWDVSMWANGRISGTVRDQAGQPLEGIRVQVFGIIPERKIVDFAPLRIGVTDVEGQYWVDRVPPGPYVVGVNAGLTDDEAYPPTMYPSGTDRERATHVMVQESSETTGIDLVLPPKREAVLIRVRVVNREGLPLRDVRVRLLNRAGEERAYSKPDSDRDGWVTLTGYRGEEYRVRAWHFNLEGTAPVQMEENRTTILVLYPAKN